MEKWAVLIIVTNYAVSLIDLNHIMLKLGYQNCLRCYYIDKNGELVVCLANQSILDMCNSMSKDKEVEALLQK